MERIVGFLVGPVVSGGHRRICSEADAYFITYDEVTMSLHSREELK